jgi:short-subunit dehydrogenase
MQKTGTILVTGCTKGIGLAIVYQFAAKGFHVIGCSRNQDALNDLQNRLSIQFPTQQFYFRACDVSDQQEVSIFASAVLSNFSQIDILIHNAGVFMPGTVLGEPDGAFETQINTNLASAYYLSRAIVPMMVKNKTGHVFTICSTASIKAYPNGGSYCMSKFALYGMTQVLREELKSTGVKVTAVLPGPTYTNSWNGTELPINRFMPADDIAKMIVAASELSESSTVEEILIRPQLGDIE